MRYGISYIAKRYSRTNNKYTQSYDAKKKQVNLLHIWVQIIYMVGNESVFTI